jgi:hypothetical protein
MQTIMCIAYMTSVVTEAGIGNRSAIRPSVSRAASIRGNGDNDPDEHAGGSSLHIDITAYHTIS